MGFKFLTKTCFGITFLHVDEASAVGWIPMWALIEGWLMSDEIELDTDDDFAEQQEPVLSEKRQMEVDREARRRLEEKLEQARLKKQIQDYDYDFDLDWGRRSTIKSLG